MSSLLPSSTASMLFDSGQPTWPPSSPNGQRAATMPTPSNGFPCRASAQSRRRHLVRMSFERTQVSSRSKAVFETVVSLLDAIYRSPGSQEASSSKALLPYPSQSPFLSTLIDRSLSQLERKQSPIVLEVVMAKYGSAPFLAATQAGFTLADSDIYDRMIRGLGTVDGGANRRSRLALSFLTARANDIGCQLCQCPGRIRQIPQINPLGTNGSTFGSRHSHQH